MAKLCSGRLTRVSIICCVLALPVAVHLWAAPPAKKTPKEADAGKNTVSDADVTAFEREAMKCRAPAVTLKSEPPRRTSEILVLGFPFGDSLGASIKAVRGTVFGFED